MKLSLKTALAASLLQITSLACFTGCDEHKPAPNPSPGLLETPAETPAPKRRLLPEGETTRLTPTNLLLDPGFGLVGDQIAYGAFMAFYEDTFREFTLETQLDSRSPAGFAGGVAIIRPSGATDTESDPVLLLTSFPGGKGPFQASMWVSKTDAKGNPAELPAEGGAVAASVMDGDPERGEAFDLVVTSETRVAGGRTWVRMRAEIAKPLAQGGFFVVHTGKAGGGVQLAAPEVTSTEIAEGATVAVPGVDGGAPTRAGALGVSDLPGAIRATPRGITSAEKRAIAKYRAVPPRLGAGAGAGAKARPAAL